MTMNHHVVTLACPWRDGSMRPVLVRDLKDISEQIFSTYCPHPLEGRKAVVPTIGGSPYVLFDVYFEGEKKVSYTEAL